MNGSLIIFSELALWLMLLLSSEPREEAFMLGLAICLTGYGIRILTLEKENSIILKYGLFLYHFLKHPLEFSGLLILCGLGLACNNLLSFIIIFPIFLVLVRHSLQKGSSNKSQITSENSKKNMNLFFPHWKDPQISRPTTHLYLSKDHIFKPMFLTVGFFLLYGKIHYFDNFIFLSLILSVFGVFLLSIFGRIWMHKKA